MTMLMHTRGPFERVPRSSESRDSAGAGVTQAHLAMIKRFCISVLTVAAAGCAIAAIMALRIIAYLPHSHYN
jgi:hypothetical protein